MFLTPSQLSSKRTAELAIEATRKLLEEPTVKQPLQEMGTKSYQRMLELLDKLYAAPIVRGGLKIPKSERKQQKLILAVTPAMALKSNDYIAGLDPEQVEWVKVQLGAWGYVGDSQHAIDGTERSVMSGIKLGLRIRAHKAKYFVQRAPQHEYPVVESISVPIEGLAKFFKNPPNKAILRGRPTILLPKDIPKLDMWPVILIYSLSLAEQMLLHPVLVGDSDQWERVLLDERMADIYTASMFETFFYRSENPRHKDNRDLLLFKEVGDALSKIKPKNEDAKYYEKVKNILIDAGIYLPLNA